MVAAVALDQCAISRGSESCFEGPAEDRLAAIG